MLVARCEKIDWLPIATAASSEVVAAKPAEAEAEKSERKFSKNFWSGTEREKEKRETKKENEREGNRKRSRKRKRTKEKETGRGRERNRKKHEED